MLNYILIAHEKDGSLSENAAVVKSIVSSEFATKIAEKHHARMINVLTGFKFIAEQIKDFQTNNSQTFMFGFEESYGYLIKPFVRDKDAIQSLVMLAEVAAFYREQGKNLYDGLQDLFKEYGYFAEKTISRTFDGIEGAAQIESLMAKFRDEAPTSFAGYSVTAMEDFAKSEKKFADGTIETIELPEANVLKYLLEDGTWIAIRPSGTEPKIKFYIGTQADTNEKAQQKRADFEKAIDQFVNE